MPDEKPMFAFHLSYPGIFLGGAAVVLAHDLREAKTLLLANRFTPDEVTRDQINLRSKTPIEPGVPYNWDGDY